MRCLLVVAVVGRSALPGADGALAFYGRDSANDPFVYGSFALALRDGGLPLANPFAGGDPVPGSYVLFAVLAGLASASGAAMPELVYRVLPLADTAALGITAIAFVRALGAPPLAWLLAPLLLLLGGDPSPLLAPLGRAFGFAVQHLDTWSLFGPYLLSFNPIGAGMQTLLCAYLLLAPGASTRRRDAIVAGLLVGALVEIKLFLWAPAIAALAAVALLWPPAAARRVLRWAAAASLLASLPSLVEKFAWAQAAVARTRRVSGSASAASRATSPTRRGAAATFPSRSSARGRGALAARSARMRRRRSDRARRPRARARRVAARHPRRGEGDRLSPARGRVTAGFRARLYARDPAAFPERGAVRVDCELRTLAVAGDCDGALAARRALAAARPRELDSRYPVRSTRSCVSAGALHSAFSISRDEQALGAALRRVSAPGDVVLEPSMLVNTDRPSSIPLFAGRPVYLSLLSAVLNLPAAERELRFARVATVFAGDDPAAAARACARAAPTSSSCPRGAAPRHGALARSKSSQRMAPARSIGLATKLGSRAVTEPDASIAPAAT